MTTQPLIDFGLSLLPKAGVLFLFALFDLLGGLYVSWQKNEVDAEKVPKFLKTFVGWVYVWFTFEAAAFIPGYLGANIAGLGDALAQYGPDVVLAFIVVTKYLGSIYKHYKEIKALDTELEPEPPQ